MFVEVFRRLATELAREADAKPLKVGTGSLDRGVLFFTFVFGVPSFRET